MRIIQFIGVTDDQFPHAVKVWGKPDFVHRWHDRRSHGDIDWDNDLIIFGDKGTAKPKKWSWQDHELN